MSRLLAIIFALLPVMASAQFPPPVVRSSLTTNLNPGILATNGTNLTVTGVLDVEQGATIGSGSDNPFVFDGQQGTLDVGAGELSIGVGRVTMTLPGGGFISITNSDFPAVVWYADGVGNTYARKDAVVIGTNFVNTLWATGGVTHLSWTLHVGKVTNEAATVYNNLTAGRALVLNAAKEATNSVTSDAEIAFLSGVTGGVQTNIDARSRVGGWIHGQVNVTPSSPADAATLYFGMSPNLTATYAEARIYIHTNCTLKGWFIRVSGTAGSGETVSHYVRVNDTTDVGQIDMAYGATMNNGTNSAVSTALVAGDVVAAKVVCPTWITNPGSLRFFALLYVE